MNLVSGPLEDVRARRREQRSWYFYDWANSAYVTTTTTVLFSPYLTSVAKAAACPDQDVSESCTTPVYLLGIPLQPGALALYVITAVTLLSALVLPVVGAMIDATPHKRRALAASAWVGSAAAASMFFVMGTNWQLGVFLLMVANLSLGISLVVYDAILCQIATPDERDGVSSRGWALGYLGGGLLLLANLVLVTGAESFGLSTGTAVRISLLSAGLWWAIFTIIPILGIRDREIPEHLVGNRENPFTQLARTIRHMAAYPQTRLFLIAYLFYNDGIQTVIASASIYGSEELKLSESQLIQTILIVQFVAFGGALLFGWSARRIGAKRSLMAGVALWCLVVAIGYFVPANNFGLFALLGSFIGIVMGGTQALSRSLFSQLVPKGSEGEYFSLYQAAERGTSWFGTFMFATIYTITDSYRSAILALVVLFVIGGFLLVKVKIREGILQAGNELPRVL